ncbi:MAG: hypothetical protein IH961_05035 [Chloroflexi bacterium]|nr:hypothetical protein [Chloroflexota bacterium]
MLNAVHIRDKYVLRFRTMWPILLGLFVLAGTACEALATESARSAVAAGREVRQLEDTEVRPLENQLRALYEDEIEPRQAEIEDLYFQEREIEDTVIRPLWDSQVDPWGPGGEASVAQQEFDARYQEIEQLYRALDLEDRELQLKYQHGSFDPWQSPEAQAKEDERYELQHELDQLYRRGWEPIEAIYDQINGLQNDVNHGDSNTQSQIDEINDQIDHLYEQANQVQFDVDDDASALYNELDNVNNDLNYLYNWVRTQIDDLWRQIENEEHNLYKSGSGSYAGESYLEELESQLRFLEEERDRIISGLYAAQDAVYAEMNDVVSEIDATIAVVEAELDVLYNSGTTATAVDPGVFATLDVLYAVLDALWNQVQAIESAANEQINALFAAKDEAVSPMMVQIADLQVQITEVDDGTASTTDAVVALAAQIEDLEDAINAVHTETENAVAAVEAQMNADLDAVFVQISNLEAEIADLEAQVNETVEVPVDSDIHPFVTALEAELVVLYALRDSEAEFYANWADEIGRNIGEEDKFWQAQIDAVYDEMSVISGQPDTPPVVDDSYLQSLYAQVDEMEQKQQSEINRLESRRSELENKVNALYSNDPAQHIYEEIDRLYGVINQIADGSQNGYDVNWDLIDQLQQQAWQMEQDLQDRTREMEDLLWALDDELQAFYRNAEVQMREMQAEMDDAFQSMQQRRYELDDMRFVIDAEMNDFFHSFDDGRHDVDEEVRKIETQLLTPIRARIRVLENELNDLRDEARALESRVREARHYIEERQREVEDQVFDLIEDAIDAASTTNALESFIAGTATIVDDPTTVPADDTDVVVEEPVAVGAGE